jgi:microcystin-dependent protein
VAETTTTNFGWTMPDPGASANTWGATLNATTQKIDNQVFLNQQAGVNGFVPVGAISMFGGAAAPTNWLLCQGQSLARTGTYAALYAIVGTAFGAVDGSHFNLPNLTNRFPMGAGTLGAFAGEATHVLSAAEMPSHAHAITDVTHGHGVNQWSHAHNIATGGHAHSVSTGSHSHGGVLISSGVTGGVPAGVGIVGNGGRTDTAGDLGGSTNTVGNLGGNTDTQTSGISIQASGTGLSATNAAGSGAAHNNLPPYLQINFIIKYQ